MSLSVVPFLALVWEYGLAMDGQSMTGWEINKEMAGVIGILIGLGIIIILLRVGAFDRMFAWQIQRELKKYRERNKSGH